MNEALRPILGRRSIRKYQNKPVEEHMLKNILSAAMAAPSAVAKDPWRFIVVTEKKQLKKLAEGLPYGPFLSSAGAGIVVLGDITQANKQEESYMLQDCSAAIENALLAAYNLGLGGCWLGVHPRQERIAYVRTMFSLPETIIPISVLSIGYPAEEKPQRTRYNEEYIHWENWK